MVSLAAQLQVLERFRKAFETLDPGSGTLLFDPSTLRAMMVPSPVHLEVTIVVARRRHVDLLQDPHCVLEPRRLGDPPERPARREHVVGEGRRAAWPPPRGPHKSQNAEPRQNRASVINSCSVPQNGPFLTSSPNS